MSAYPGRRAISGFYDRNAPHPGSEKASGAWTSAPGAIVPPGPSFRRDHRSAGVLNHTFRRQDRLWARQYGPGTGRARSGHSPDRAHHTYVIGLP